MKVLFIYIYNKFIYNSNNLSFDIKKFIGRYITMCSYYPLTIDLNENSNERYITRHNSNLDYLTKNLIREFKEFKNIPNSLKELYSKKTIDLIYDNFLSIDEKKLIEKYTKNELKIMCKNNYVTTVGVRWIKI